MRSNRLSTYIAGVLLSAIALSFVPVQAPTVHAALSTGVDSSGNSVTTSNSPGSDPNAGIPDSSFVGPTPEQAGKTLSADGTSATPTPINGDIGCSLSGTGIAICLTNVIYVFTVGIGTVFAYVAAFFFDIAIQLSIQSTAYALDFLSTGWTLVRDMANMTFVFIMIWIAVSVALDAANRMTMSTLVGVIVMALLVNFSFFFTRVAIDAGNLLTVQFYNAIQAPPISVAAQNSGLGSIQQAANLTANLTSSVSNGQMKDLTAGIMGAMQLNSLFSTAGFQGWVNSGNAGFLTGFITLSFLYLAAAALFWGLTVTFITVGIKFLVRIVTLWFLLIVSPLAFAARAIPRFRDQFDEWLRLLINNSFYPAGFMFVFFILTLFSNQLAGGNLIDNLFGTVSNTASGLNFIQLMGIAVANSAIRLGFIIAVMWMGLRASEIMGASTGKWGAEFANNAGKWAGGQYFSFATNPAALTGRALWAARNLPGNAVQGTLNASARTGNNSLLWRGVGALVGRRPNETFTSRDYRRAQRDNERLTQQRANAQPLTTQQATQQLGGPTTTAAPTANNARVVTPAVAQNQPAAPAAAGTPRRVTNAPGTTATANPAQATRAPSANAGTGNIVSSANLQKILQGFNVNNLKKAQPPTTTISTTNLTTGGPVTPVSTTNLNLKPVNQATVQAAQQAKAAIQSDIQARQDALVQPGAPQTNAEVRAAFKQQMGDMKDYIRNNTNQIREAAANTVRAAATSLNKALKNDIDNVHAEVGAVAKAQESRAKAAERAEILNEKQSERTKSAIEELLQGQTETKSAIEEILHREEPKPPTPPTTPAGGAQTPAPQDEEGDSPDGLRKAA